MNTSIRFQAVVERLKRIAFENPDLEEITAEFHPVSLEELLSVKNDFQVKIEDRGMGSYSGYYSNTLNEDKKNECRLTIYVRFQNKEEFDLMGIFDKMFGPQTV